MSEKVIRLHNLGKKYQIGRTKWRSRSFRETLIGGFGAPLRRTWRLAQGHATGAADLDQDFWALEDISFDVSIGEVVGIIGRNGAGKSTLLKLLARVTEPTLGYADIYGRIGALLEVGTGFHRELTGRENVYLNGAILGMTRKEIDRRFDEIVAFAEVDQFIDTPVKHYSSGMSLRLAFSVAAHLEPEILIVDEVLAVGDASFRKKCLNRMEEVGKAGRTVLFVSHNMPAVTRLCERVILLDKGKLIADGSSKNVVPAYLNSGMAAMAERNWSDRAPGDHVVRLRSVRASTEESRVANVVEIRQPVFLEMDYEILEPGFEFLLYFELFTEEGTSILTTFDTDEEWQQRPRPAGFYTSRAWIPSNFLQEGTVYVAAAARTTNPLIRRFRANEAIMIQIIVEGADPDLGRANFGGLVSGTVRPLLKWTTEVRSSRVS